MTSSQWSSSFSTASTSSMALYDDVMVPRMFEPWARLLLDVLSVDGGQDLLDVACGPGTVTRLAARRIGTQGSVTGCDFSLAMLDLARAKGPIDAGAPIRYLECPADALDVSDSAFDVVTCQQGLQFFPDRAKAMAEMKRALRPGGRLGISVWCGPEDNPPFLALATAIEAVLGTHMAATYKGGPWGFDDVDAMAHLADGAGFSDIEVRRHELPIVFEGGPAQLMSTLRASAVAVPLDQLSEADQMVLVTAVNDATRDITVDGIVCSHTSSHILTATAGDA